MLGSSRERCYIHPEQIATNAAIVDGVRTKLCLTCTIAAMSEGLVVERLVDGKVVRLSGDGHVVKAKGGGEE